MARTFWTSWDWGHRDIDGGSTGNTALPSGVSYESTITHNSRGKSIKIVAASSAGTANLTFGGNVAASTSGYLRFYVRITALPASGRRLLFGGTSFRGIYITSTGAIEIRDGSNGSALQATSTTLLTDSTKWYCIQMRSGLLASGDTIGKVDDESLVLTGASGNQTSWTNQLGAPDLTANTYTAYFDDFSVDDTTWCGKGGVVLSLPTADNSVGSGWQVPGGATTNLFEALNNTPPIGVADSTSSAQAGNQIRNASTNNASYVATMQSYTAAGVPAGATVNAVTAIGAFAAPVTTGAKTGSLQITSNPAEASALALQNSVANDFWSGAAAGTYPTGWKWSRGNLTVAPSVVLGTAPQLTLAITGGTASRIAMSCALGIYVDYTEAAITNTVTADVTISATATVNSTARLQKTGACTIPASATGAATSSSAVRGAASTIAATASVAPSAGANRTAASTIAAAAQFVDGLPLIYLVGDSLALATVSRASSATYSNEDGSQGRATSHVARDAHYGT